MYLNHYNLKLMPFEIGPDPKFLWLGSKHKEAYSALRYGILESKGFIVILGDPGTGKSTLLNATAANFGSNIRFAKITDPAMNEMDFFNFAANAFEMSKIFKSKAEFLIEFEKFVKDAGAQAKKVILVIDEAQRLTADMLEQIRVFSNVETPGQKVVSCIFAGQTEFLDMVIQNRALTQRVFFSHIIHPLTQSETGDYIKHRLKVAGTEEQIFTAPAVEEIFRLTGGTPRLINILCDQALLGGYAQDKKKIGLELIRESTENTLISLTTQKESAAEAQRPEPSKQSAPTEPAAGNTIEIPRNGLAYTHLRTPSHKTAYWASIALIVILGLAAYLYQNDGFRAAINGTQSDPGQAQNVVTSADSVAGAGEIGWLQRHMLDLKRVKDNVGIRISDLRKRFVAPEQDKQALNSAIVELEKKLENVRPVQELLKGEVHTLKEENTRIQSQLVDINTQKSAAAQLEAAVSERDKKLIYLEQKFRELEKALTIKEDAKDKLGVELAARHAAIVDLQQQLKTSISAQLQSESDLQRNQRENARLRSQLQKIKAQRMSLPPASAPEQEPATSQSPPFRPGATPKPAGAFDVAYKKETR